MIRSIAAIVRKEFYQIRRDPVMLRLIFLAPILQLFILGYAVSTDVKYVYTGVYDYDHSTLSRTLVRSMAVELSPYGIRVNAIAPGIVATPINRALQKKNSAFIQAAVESALTGQMTTPEEIAELVFFLVSSAAKNLTGQVISIDGAASATMVMDRFMHGMVAKSSQREKNKLIQ